MPGNLLHGNLSIPEVSGDDTQKDIKTILNYLYQLQEQLRYTMRNIGEENFNEDELERLSVKITGGAGMAQINAKVDDMGATLNLLSMYTGLNEVVTVDSAEDMTDDSKTYRIGDKYYKHNGTEWVEDTNIVTAAITLAAINGQSAIKIKADNIDFTGHTTFARVSDIGELDENDKTIIFGNRIKTGTLYADALATSTSNDGWNYVAMKSGFDFINPDYMPITSSSYAPSSRAILGLYGIAFVGDNKLSATGRGTAGNTVTESVGNIIARQSSTGTIIRYGLDVLSQKTMRIVGQAWGPYGVDDGVKIYSRHPDRTYSAGTTMCTIRITDAGIVAEKLQMQSNGFWNNLNTATII